VEFNRLKIFMVLFILLTTKVLLASDSNFNIGLKLYKPIAIDKIQDLLFPDTTITGSSFDITVGPNDIGAASFIAEGGKNRSISTSIVESSINMNAPGVSGSIAVDTFVLNAPAAFNSSGKADITVGATASVNTSQDGDYVGIATLRVIYN
jgi:hypothetical protein